MTKLDLTKIAKSYGYSVKFTDGEIEAYPKTMRGKAAFFESDDMAGRISILATIKADFSCRFAKKLSQIHLPTDIRESLQKWHDFHKLEWIENLYFAWMYGQYDGFSSSMVSGDLQILRNTDGHNVMKLLAA